ncbi:MAG: O-antigen ligase family protein [Acidobacteria bacterium]|nr:O-antigen ligase family protein [Acidobacteriota bacterium]
MIILRPVAAFVSVVALFAISGRQMRRLYFAFAMIGACIASVLLQLIPMPYGWWTALAGRELATQAVATADLGHSMQPISLAPMATWNALYSLTVPLAMLALLAGIEPSRRFRLLPMLLLFGFVSGLLGVIQAANPGGELYFYDVTNRGAAVGLYANRNHQATLIAMMVPMLAVFAASDWLPMNSRMRTVIAIGASIVLVPLLLVTGSRAGLGLMLIGFASIVLLYRPNGNPFGALPRRLRRLAMIAGSGGLLLIVTMMTAVAALPRAEAIRRLFAVQDDADMRLMIWRNSWPLVRQYAPWGSGQGSFPAVYAAIEPTNELDGFYVNHAHNDWLEVLLTGGLPAMLILAVAVLAACYAIKRLFIDRNPVTPGLLMGRLGIVLIIIMACASVVDYPLRTPSMTALFVIAVVWTCDAIADMGRPQTS